MEQFHAKVNKWLHRLYTIHCYSARSSLLRYSGTVRCGRLGIYSLCPLIQFHTHTLTCVVCVLTKLSDARKSIVTLMLRSFHHFIGAENCANEIVLKQTNKYRGIPKPISPLQKLRTETHFDQSSREWNPVLNLIDWTEWEVERESDNWEKKSRKSKFV